ncbi:MAG: glycoside hydrolase family 43 protein [Acidobacteriaceae bacterium]|nr:glycoside hydrolase family 43 protein [Acidobacteriaceae bacterium]MBV9295629.1 glycoside hydrolase family 43 protein [Acidobacteriaceae bacterium]MBV9766668.1 glycoside hydrolase family 43 protein [Acidobacteriaceae bacterium]
MPGQYQNPVHKEYFADPFVWKHDGEYYAVGGGISEGEPRVFSVLQSDDLVDWRKQGRALAALAPEYGTAYWAPEIAFCGTQFWMYYSVGFGDKWHHLRVAVSAAPGGPYVDTGTRLTDPFTCPFAIDPSPFQDEDGTWYLFYARDFLHSNDGARPGTGIVVDRLIAPKKLAGETRCVARPQYDWQRFMKNRVMYGAVFDWHTMEGPCVRKRNGRYWCLYSGGRWENNTYGLDYVVGDNVLGPYVPCGDDSAGPRLSRTIPGKVIGPGHKSIVIGPGSSTEYLVYHAWDVGMSSRKMCIDPIDWTPEGPKTPGPTHTPQPLR